jgi:hypothetical protein
MARAPFRFVSFFVASGNIACGNTKRQQKELPVAILFFNRKGLVR